MASYLTRFCLFVFQNFFLRIALVENIPEGLNYSENAPFHLSLFQGWMNLLNMAKKSVDIVSSHWDLNHSHPSACQVSCIFCVCDDFTSVHFTLLSIPASILKFKLTFCLFKTHNTHTSLCLYVCAVANHVAQLLTECLAFKGKVTFHLCIPQALYTASLCRQLRGAPSS